jgi:quercetin dioxygenase-like cupin family protein
MSESTVKKVEAATSPKGDLGQRYLVSGKLVSMRLWKEEPANKTKAATKRDYETVGYVISGRAKLDLEGQTIDLKPGDSWLVPAKASHRYTILEPLTVLRQPRPQPRSTGETSKRVVNDVTTTSSSWQHHTPRGEWGVTAK